MFNRDQEKYYQKIQKIHDLILEAASGNFEAHGIISEDQDDLDAIVSGINMLIEELKESTVSRDYLDNIFTGIVDMVIIMDATGNIRSINNELTKTLGYIEKDLIQKPFAAIFHGNSKRTKSIFKKLEAKQHFHAIEKVFRAKDGRKIPVSCSGSILFDKQKKETGILCIARDISNLKKTEQELLDKNREMDQFVYKASHDIKGPLASIIGLTDLATGEIKDPEALEYFSMINKTANKLNNTLIGLLNLTMLEKAKKI